MSEVKRPVLRYHGGKWKLAPWIIEHMPPHRVYVEPFGGAGSVLMRKPRSYAEFYNDQWKTVVNVFQVLRDPEKAARLAHLIELTPFARDEFAAAAHEDTDDDVERARKSILRSLAGFGSASTNGTYLTGFRSNSNRSGTTPALDWRNYPKHIGSFVERLSGVIIENKDASEVIQRTDSPETLFYVDPPYPHSTRNMRRGNAAYHEEMNDEDHAKLAQILHQVKGMVILSTYQSDLYDSLYLGWHIERKSTFADGASPREELLYLNPACASAQRQIDFDIDVGEMWTEPTMP